MKLITTIIRPDRLPAVKEALFSAGVTGITISRVSGHGGESDFVESYRGSSMVLEFHDKVKIEMAHASQPMAARGSIYPFLPLYSRCLLIAYRSSIVRYLCSPRVSQICRYL